LESPQQAAGTPRPRPHQRSRRATRRLSVKPRVGKPAHDAALHFLARPKQYLLTDAERADLIHVVEGYTSPHDHDAARRGIEWMRERHRRLGQTPRF
jgi:hypothetical protein